MGIDRERLEEEYESTLKWIFDACFGRRPATDEEMGEKIHLFGSIKRLLGRER